MAKNDSAGLRTLREIAMAHGTKPYGEPKNYCPKCGVPSDVAGGCSCGHKVDTDKTGDLTKLEPSKISNDPKSTVDKDQGKE